jgi:heme/copper-type cytochrome/quinol oxidase subunit 2
MRLRDMKRISSPWVVGATIVVLGCGGYLAGSRAAAPQERSFTILAHKYAYDPQVIRVNRGDTVHLHFASLDVVHGFYLEGHDLNVTIRPMQSTVEVTRPSRPGTTEVSEEVVFRAGHEGKFRYRCSHTCGFMHPFMLGEMIVGPNRLLPTSVGMAMGALLGGLLVAWGRGEKA